MHVLDRKYLAGKVFHTQREPAEDMVAARSSRSMSACKPWNAFKGCMSGFPFGSGRSWLRR